VSSGLLIINKRVVFQPYEIDIDKWLKDYHNGLIFKSDWWLVGNWKIVEGCLVIRFGSGRCGHSFATLGQMVDHCIRPFMLCDKSHTFNVGHMTQHTVNLKTGEWQ